MDQVSSVSSSDSSPTGNEAPAGNEQGAGDYLRELQSVKQENQGLTSQFNKIKAAFSDDAGKEVDPDDKMLDMYLEAALEDQKQGGKGLPLTTKLAMELVATKKAMKEMQAAIKQMSGRQEFDSRPDTKYDQDAYSTLDMSIQEAIGSIYGEENPSMFKAVTEQLANEINSIKANKPEMWAQIRRNPEYLKRLGMHFVEKCVPKKAREMMTAERERNTPMTQSDLAQALREANELRDPQARSKVKEAIRQKMLEVRYSGNE